MCPTRTNANLSFSVSSSRGATPLIGSVYRKIAHLCNLIHWIEWQRCNSTESICWISLKSFVTLILSLTSSFQRIILPECWYWITLDRTQKANLMSNSNICDIRFITNIHIWFCGRNRLYRKPDWINWNSINKSISIMSLLLMLRQGICIFIENKKYTNCILNLLFKTVNKYYLPKRS